MADLARDQRVFTHARVIETRLRSAPRVAQLATWPERLDRGVKGLHCDFVVMLGGIAQPPDHAGADEVRAVAFDGAATIKPHLLSCADRPIAGRLDDLAVSFGSGEKNERHRCDRRASTGGEHRRRCNTGELGFGDARLQCVQRRHVADLGEPHRLAQPRYLVRALQRAHRPDRERNVDDLRAGQTRHQTLVVGRA